MVVFEFEKLVVYCKARAFRKRIYRLSRLLPADEFKLKVQMRDAARSLTNNIAEGHGRYTFKERVRFCMDSRGSLQELVDNINLCEDEGYAKPAHLETIRVDAAEVLKLINGYVAYLRRCAVEDKEKRKPKKLVKRPELTQLT